MTNSQKSKKKKKIVDTADPVAYLQRVLSRWSAFCKGHRAFERAIRSVLLENETLKQRIKELENQDKKGQTDGELHN